MDRSPCSATAQCSVAQTTRSNTSSAASDEPSRQESAASPTSSSTAGPNRCSASAASDATCSPIAQHLRWTDPDPPHRGAGGLPGRGARAVVAPTTRSCHLSTVTGPPNSSPAGATPRFPALTYSRCSTSPRRAPTSRVVPPQPQTPGAVTDPDLRLKRLDERHDLSTSLGL